MSLLSICELNLVPIPAFPCYPFQSKATEKQRDALNRQIERNCEAMNALKNEATSIRDTPVRELTIAQLSFDPRPALLEILVEQTKIRTRYATVAAASETDRRSILDAKHEMHEATLARITKTNLELGYDETTAESNAKNHPEVRQLKMEILGLQSQSVETWINETGRNGTDRLEHYIETLRHRVLNI